MNTKATKKVKALTVKNPYATYIVEGKKTIEVRSRNTTFRGKVHITSSIKPIIHGMKSGFLLGTCEIYGTKPVKEFTRQDFIATCIPEEFWKDLYGYGWLLRNAEIVPIQSVKGQLGIFNLKIDDSESIPKKKLKFLEKLLNKFIK